MNKILIAAVTAASCLFAAPSFAASAQHADGSFDVAQVDVRIGSPHRPAVVVRERRPSRVIVKRDRCRMVETRTRRPNGTVVIRRERRCY